MAGDSQSSVPMWICLMLSVALIAARLALRRFRAQGFTRGDYWCLGAAVCIMGRLLANHFLLLYGSTRILSSQRRIELLDPALHAELYKVVTGSKLVLATRSLLICVLWCLKMAVLDLLARLIMKMPYERKVLYVFWTALAVTFTASIVTVFVECHPLKRHWQINPDPGNCVVGNIWLFTYEISNILTDVLLMALPFSLILSVKIPTMQRLRLLFLFSIGIFLIAVSIMRIMLGKNSRIQSAHTMWASLEILFAVIVAVTPTIYALVRNRREDTSYPNQSHISMTGRTYPGASVSEIDRYAARVWTELEDGASRTDNTSIEGILVERRYETSDTKL
ncbi:Nn.00g023950.m01.CDS01 [Neocucurbitaria sp. VM-36]